MNVKSSAQILHVSMIRCDVQYSGQWLCQFDWKVRVGLSEWHGSVQTARVASVINAVALVKSNAQHCAIVFANGHGYIQMSYVAVTDSSGILLK